MNQGSGQGGSGQTPGGGGPAPRPQPAPVASAGDAQVFPLHAGARSAYLIAAVLLFFLFFLIFPLLLGIWMLVARARAQLELRGTELTARFFVTRRWDLTRLRRLGLLRMPLRARGLAAALARKKLGGDFGLNLCGIDDQGKLRTVLLSTYERPDEIIERVAALTRLPVETVEMGFLAHKWPEQ